MTDTSERLAERLLLEGQKTADYFLSLAPQAWEVIIYDRGVSWNVHQVLAHLVSAEKANAQVIADVLSGGEGAPVDFDIDNFNLQEVTRGQEESRESLLTRFIGLRRLTADLVLNMKPEDLVRSGRHPFFGLAPLEDIIKLIYRHNQIHLRDIRRAVRT